jgi:hypothetical protein
VRVPAACRTPHGEALFTQRSDLLARELLIRLFGLLFVGTFGLSATLNGNLDGRTEHLFFYTQSREGLQVISCMRGVVFPSPTYVCMSTCDRVALRGLSHEHEKTWPRTCAGSHVWGRHEWPAINEHGTTLAAAAAAAGEWAM